MTSPLSPGGGLLPFAGYSIRYLIDETTGATWLAARDVLNILRLDISRNPGRHLTNTPEVEKSFRTLLSAQGPQRSIVITPAAAIALTRQRKRAIDRQVRACLTHHAAVLGLEAA